ncbi:MAG: hypothetical protein QM635_08960 [Microbacteriaceae bacterium]
MAILQIKGLADDVHAALAARARAEGTTMSDLAARMIERELGRRTMRDWVATLPTSPVRDIDTLGALDAARDELGRA